MKLSRWAILVTANVALWCVLGFYQTTPAASQQRGEPQRSGQLPFGNAVEQRNEMIRELREISGLLKEQNELLRAANRKVDSHAGTAR